MRDGPPRDLAPPPWFMPPRVQTLAAGAPATTDLSDSPSMSMAYQFTDLTLRGRVRDPRQAIQQGNVVNHARRRTVFHTWVAARRNDAPLDRFSTRFLDGRLVIWSMDVDVIGQHATGTFDANFGATPPADTSPMQLRGPTPAEVDPMLRIIEVRRPLPRARAGGVSLEEFRRRVREVAGELEPLRLALGLDGRLMVRVRVDEETGRVVIDRPDRRAVTVEELDANRAAASAEARLAQEFLIRLRKDLVLAPLSPDPARVPIPTVLSSIEGGAARVEGPENPFAPEHGIGLLGHLREVEEERRSQEQLAQHPEVYDPGHWPPITVEMQGERYLYDFTVSGVDIDLVCQDPSMRTAGCVTARVDDPNFVLRIAPEYRRQSLSGETFNSPVSLQLTSFPVTFTLYMPRESPGGSTLNHELHHLVTAHDFVEVYKDRLARRVRARLMEVRRLAAENPRLKESLLARDTLLEIARQEDDRFRQFFWPEYMARQERVHEQEAHEGLPPVQIPPSWTDFRMPPIRGGTRGTFTP